MVQTASLATIAPIAVSSSQGIQVSLDGSGSTNPQTFIVTSSNPDVKVAVPTGQFWTINVSHTAASGHPTDVTFSGPITFQMFQNLTPATVAHFDTFIGDSYYVGKDITRIVKNFSSTGDYVIQGGAPNPDGSGSSNQPGTPYGLELSQQLTFNGPNTLAVANTGQPNSNDTQFFFDTAAESVLNYGYTIFGQVVSGQSTIANIEKVAVQANANREVSSPISPVTITTSTKTDTNPNGVVQIDATGAVPGETSNITVTATDPTTHTTASQTFAVTVGANVGNSNNNSANITFKPLAYPVTQDIIVSKASTVQLKGNSENPKSSAVKLGYTIATQPTHGTISSFNATTGALTYTPTAGYTGPDAFTYSVTNTGGTPATLAGNTAAVTLNVTNSTTAPLAQPVIQTITGGVANSIQLVGNSENPHNPSVVLSYKIVSQPSHGTISGFNASTGILTYTPATGFSGADSFSYSVINTGGSPSPQQGNTATVSLTVTPASAAPVHTATVRQIGTVLVVTPLPRTDKGTNNIVVNETNNTSSPASNIVVVSVNGQYDTLQPLASGITSVVVYGSKASDNITVNPAVDSTIAVSLNGGQGGKNVIQAGAGPSRLHGWYGENTLIGGTGTNQLVGRVGHVKFKPSSTTNEIFAGEPRPGYSVHRHLFHNAYHLTAPGGTFYKDVKGKLVAIPTPKASPTTNKTKA